MAVLNTLNTLAGLEEITQSTPHEILQLNDNQIRLAVAFRLTEGTGNDPAWYESLLEARPDLVAEVMISYVIAALRSKKQHIIGLYALAYIDAYKPVARLASLPILKAFPVRCTNQQLVSLHELLKAVLRYADRHRLLMLIREKLKRSSMNPAQRVLFLATGLIAAPDEYLGPLTEFTNGREKCIRHLAGFLDYRHDQWSPLNELPTSAVGLLVHLVGGNFAPYRLEGCCTATPAMSAADSVSGMIKHLGSLPGKETTEVLAALLAEGELHHWHDALQRAQFEQFAICREASFRHPDIKQVSDALNNRSPVNAADLAALTINILRELANKIRNGNTDDYGQFWNEKGRHGKLDTPKHENACRDALLSDLQQRLTPLGIDAQREGSYADNNRADIRVTFGGTTGFDLPIEIKKNSHTNLWSAIHSQLIAKYTREPRAHGFGIYLVFWFGADLTQPSAKGPRPCTANELEECLRAMLSVDEGRKIAVCVIDVAKPTLI